MFVCGVLPLGLGVARRAILRISLDPPLCLAAADPGAFALGDAFAPVMSTAPSLAARVFCLFRFGGHEGRMDLAVHTDGCTRTRRGANCRPSTPLDSAVPKLNGWS